MNLNKLTDLTPKINQVLTDIGFKFGNIEIIVKDGKVLEYRPQVTIR